MSVFYQQFLPFLFNHFVFNRDPRFSNETLVFVQILAKNATPESKTFEVEPMRQQIEELHEKGNAKFIGTFKGNLEEQIVKTNSAGRFFCLKE